MQNTGKNTQKHAAGGVIILALLALIVGGVTQPVSAQISTPTPLPQVVATRQAAGTSASTVGDLQAERADMQKRLDEINRNIENQIKDATQAASDAHIATATQNAEAMGAAIGRMEGALAQLRESYAGKDAIISDLQARLDQSDEQIATDNRTIDKLKFDLQKEQTAKKDAVNAYTALTEQRKTNEQNDMVSNAIWLIVALALLFGMIAFLAFVLQRARSRTVVIEPPHNEEAIESEIVPDEEDAQ